MLSNDAVVATFRVLNYVSILALVYAAYWALDIRRALAVRLYRNRAFGVGLLSLIIALGLFTPSLSGATAPAKVLVVGVNSILVLGLLYFVDASVIASRRSDPLLRDTLHWSKARFVVWAWEIFNVCFILFGVTASAVTGNPSFSNQISDYDFNTGLPSIIYDLFWLVPFLAAIVIVPVAIRAKDPSLQKHFKWLALFVIVVLINIGANLIASANISSSFSFAQNLLGGIFLSLGTGYCLYKSARSLVPLNRIQP